MSLGYQVGLGIVPEMSCSRVEVWGLIGPVAAARIDVRCRTRGVVIQNLAALMRVSEYIFKVNRFQNLYIPRQYLVARPPICFTLDEAYAKANLS
jgi:hypothetical protein